MTPMRLALLLAATSAIAVAGCHRRDADGASSADSHAPGTTDAKVAAACSAYPPGSAGVVRTFCDGSAVVNVTVAGVAHAMHGGTCENQSGLYTVNVGVISGPGLAGPKPDYFGLAAQGSSPTFTNAILSATVDGKGYAVTSNTGQLTPQGGSFTGTALTGETVTGSFTC